MAVTKSTPDLFAVALATHVPPQPRGPYNNTPVAQPGPMAAYCSVWAEGSLFTRYSSSCTYIYKLNHEKESNNCEDACDITD